MQNPLASLPLPPPELMFNAGEVPADALFFDTNSALQAEAAQVQPQGRPALISSLVYAELITRRKGAKGLRIIEMNLVDRGLRVVSFDHLSARCFFELNRQLRFDAPPLLRQQETERSCRDRLRFDLAVFAAALRHRATLITDNIRDFEHFPYREFWKTRAEAFG
ncbi:type II toxin-antitoxin system VapC family toxin [Cystobacter fuscus]|uniref:type II toxin-antitoxin system VapC family toxin n=1 Tax=Cystobacter fuscus TaxID=43 RepID=UPI002B2DB771|nr:type II toxin-antitoxin system VapC family toxin [Cystobacter fuscus]